MDDQQIYKPQESMTLWWLGDGAAPRAIGTIFLAEGNRKVGLEYAPDWLSSGFSLSEDLPLVRGAFLPKERDMAAGAVDDARPDRWGERVIRNLYKPSRLSVLEYLYFAGDDRFGALGVSLASQAYIPSSSNTMPSLSSLGDMQKAIATIVAGEQLDEKLVRLVKPGPSFGGARPKSLILMDGVQWIVKFSEGEDFDTELVEHATMKLAQQCGIHVAQTKALPLDKGHAVAVQRFDRDGGQRAHVISANTVLRASGMSLGYPEMAQCLRKIARPEGIKVQQKELFRRMVFNILMDNTDDHEKNHAFIRSRDGSYSLSPAYDVIPSVQGLGQQQLRIGAHEAESSLENALSQVSAFGMHKDEAAVIVERVAKGVAVWKSHFKRLGVSGRDIEKLEQYIDGPFLKVQRDEFSLKQDQGLSH